MNLKFLSTFLKRKQNIEEVSVISSLAPKVLMNEEDLKKVEPYLDKLKDTLNAMIAEQTGQPIEVIEKDTDRDNFMSAQQACDYGLIDEVITKHK